MSDGFVVFHSACSCLDMPLSGSVMIDVDGEMIEVGFGDGLAAVGYYRYVIMEDLGSLR